MSGTASVPASKRAVVERELLQEIEESLREMDRAIQGSYRGPFAGLVSGLGRALFSSTRPWWPMSTAKSGASAARGAPGSSWGATRGSTTAMVSLIETGIAVTAACLATTTALGVTNFLQKTTGRLGEGSAKPGG